MTDYTPVTSSNVDAVGYDAEKNELFVKFLNGSEYKYAEVPVEEFQALIAAPSVGKHLNSNIKPRFAAERV